MSDDAPGPYSNPESECDVIMKGGITSGVVYPHVVLELAKKYRFKNVGGTSAGAIAAAITAAAELDRDGDGFNSIERIPGYLSSNLEGLFQPVPELSRLYNLLLKLQEKEGGGFSKALLVVRSTAYNWLRGRGHVKAARKRLPENGFGFCTGLTQPGYDKPGLTNWLTEQIETAAGRIRPGDALPDRPLLFSDLWQGKVSRGVIDELAPHARIINLQMVTSNLSERRPHTLPDLNKNIFFRKEDFEKLFPDSVVRWLTSAVGPYAKNPEFYYFPVGGKMPVVVAVRMSLSFPLLFSAIPLYKKFFPDTEADDGALDRIWFSDGGLTSNFPIHFFDSFLPTRPTFGVSLNPFDPRLQSDRIHLPLDARQGQWVSINSIGSLMQFIRSLFDAAKDWPDMLQGLLPGYRERVVHIGLTNEEGGLNLTMPPALIDKLVGYGVDAGAELTRSAQSGGFDFNDHRWRRFLVLYARLEETFEQMAQTWGDDSQTNGFKTTIRNMLDEPSSFAASSKQDRQKAYDRMDGLIALTAGWANDPVRDKLKPPKPDSTLSVRPKY